LRKGVYEGRWFDPEFKKSSKTQTNDPELRESRIWSEAEAKSIVIACQNKSGTVQEEAKPSTQQAPQLFDLTSLQREANALFGFSARILLVLLRLFMNDTKYLPIQELTLEHFPKTISIRLRTSNN
jgi:DNA topoisomerase-3